jgi:hypothetical protein
MNEQELREMVRESIARQRGGESAAGPDWVHRDTVRLKADATDVGTSAAFVRLPFVRSGDEDGNCIIEPAVRCNHCGYCQSYGH